MSAAKNAPKLYAPGPALYPPGPALFAPQGNGKPLKSEMRVLYKPSGEVNNAHIREHEARIKANEARALSQKKMKAADKLFAAIASRIPTSIKDDQKEFDKYCDGVLNVFDSNNAQYLPIDKYVPPYTQTAQWDVTNPEYNTSLSSRLKAAMSDLKIKDNIHERSLPIPHLFDYGAEAAKTVTSAYHKRPTVTVGKDGTYMVSYITSKDRVDHQMYDDLSTYMACYTPLMLLSHTLMMYDKYLGVIDHDFNDSFFSPRYYKERIDELNYVYHRLAITLKQTCDVMEEMAKRGISFAVPDECKYKFSKNYDDIAVSSSLISIAIGKEKVKKRIETAAGKDILDKITSHLDHIRSLLEGVDASDVNVNIVSGGRRRTKRRGVRKTKRVIRKTNRRLRRGHSKRK